MAVGAALALAACGGTRSATDHGAGSTSLPAPVITTSTTATSTTATMPTPAAQPPFSVEGVQIQYHGQRSVIGQASTEVVARDLYFVPSVLIGSPGEHLAVKVVNEGQAAHTFTVASQHIDVMLQPGKTSTVEVIFPQAGRLAWTCKYHVGAGMAGLLVAS